MNPIEAIRMNERISQTDFSVKLGYPNKHQYIYHVRNFTLDIIQKINAIYERDITMDIINHLKCEIRSLKKQNKVIKKELDKTRSNDNDKSINSMMDKL